jgi:hypothetical protein
MRYLIPLPIPQRWRRRLIAAGSGNATRIICSALIAQAFEIIRYPVLPSVARLEIRGTHREMLQIRHSSLYAPRDFDISPYFQIIKPALVRNFNYKFADWVDLPAQPVMQNDEGRTSATPTDSKSASLNPHSLFVEHL